MSTDGISGSGGVSDAEWRAFTAKYEDRFAEKLSQQKDTLSALKAELERYRTEGGNECSKFLDEMNERLGKLGIV